MAGEHTLAKPKLKVTLWCTPTPPNQCVYQVSTFYTLRNPRNSPDKILKLIVKSRDGSVPKMCTSGGRQCKTVPIPGLYILVNPNQTWTFPLNKIAIKVPKYTKYEVKANNFLIFLVCSQYFKFSFNFVSWQARLKLYIVATKTWQFCST